MRVVQVLDSLGVEYGATDVLPALDPLREATGETLDWRTFPQLYVNGELVGGADIVEEMFESGELSDLLDVKQPVDASGPKPPSGAPTATCPRGRARRFTSSSRHPRSATCPRYSGNPLSIRRIGPTEAYGWPANGQAAANG